MSAENHPFQKVLVATDLSEIAAAALHAGLGLVSRLKGQPGDISVLHVRHAQQTLLAAEAAFEEHLERAYGEQARLVGQLMRGGTPAETIVEVAVQMEADLIVMGTHGRTGFRRLIMGSVAEQVVREAPCPVLSIGHRPLAYGRRMPKNAKSLFPLRTIVVPTDGSPCSHVGEDLAAILATVCNADVHLVHAVGSGWAAGADEAVLESKRKVGEAARALRARRPRGAPEVRIHDHARTGDPAEQIDGCARELRADLIVMGTHGGTGVRERTIGGHTDQVMRLSPCPILAVREKSLLVTESDG